MSRSFHIVQELSLRPLRSFRNVKADLRVIVEIVGRTYGHAHEGLLFLLARHIGGLFKASL